MFLKQALSRTGSAKLVCWTGLVAMLMIGVAGCRSGSPTDTPGVDRMGKYVLRYTGPEIEAALGYRYAALHSGEEWLMVDLALTGAHGEVTKVERGDIWVRNPKGEKIPMARQEDFSQAFGALRPKLRQAGIMHDPLDYFPPNRTDCRVGFFATPGEGVVFEELTVDIHRVCQGRIFFRVPGGVIPGRWVLGIDLQETKVRIPFKIAEE